MSRLIEYVDETPLTALNQAALEEAATDHHGETVRGLGRRAGCATAAEAPIVTYEAVGLGFSSVFFFFASLARTSLQTVLTAARSLLLAFS
jgi:hypothetical protein